MNNYADEFLVSIIVAAYNVEHYLYKCINSILTQTYSNIEILVINDGSTDNTECIARSFNDSRLFVFNKSNGGLSDARNYGISKAKGEFLCFIDGDDYISSNYIENFVKNQLTTNSDLVVANYYEDDGEINCKELNFQNKLIDTDEYLNLLYNDSYAYFVVAWNKLYRKSIFNSIKYPYGKYHEDEFIIHEIVEKCERICLTNATTYYYVQRKGSIMSEKYSFKRLDRIDALLNRIVFLTERGLIYPLEHSLNQCAYYLVEGYYNLKDTKYIRDVLEKKGAFKKIFQKSKKIISIKEKIYISILFISFRLFRITRYLLKKDS